MVIFIEKDISSGRVINKIMGGYFHSFHSVKICDRTDLRVL